MNFFISKNFRSKWAASCHDILIIPIAWLTAYWIRFNFEVIPPSTLDIAFQALLYVIPAQIIAFWHFGLYRGVWRYASLPDLVRIIKATIVGVSLSIIVMYAVSGITGIPRSIPVLYGILLVLLLSGSRFTYRWMKDRHIYQDIGKRVLIIGAGRAGEILLREIQQDINRRYYPAAFVDDDKNKQHRDIHGVRVVGSISDVDTVIHKHSIDTIFIALPSASTHEIQKIYGLCESTQLPIRMLPKFDDMTSKRITVDELREVSIDDLLGREPVSLNWTVIEKSFSTKVILISGGGGSIGSELCRQLCSLTPEKLIIVEQSEFNLYEIERELISSFPNTEIVSILCDVAETKALDLCFARYKPDTVFHAAAYKHVPMLQKNICEGFENNVIGTHNIASLADKHRCDSFVLISTDKAVHPSNYMGTTKRIAEQCCQLLSSTSDTRFITVRFGNVLGSAGSVIPLFKEQIKNGGPVTVTHENINRYFMTIKEACLLIMQSSVIGKGGEIFVLDMGEPVSIKYLAEKLITLSGKIPQQDIIIKYTGLRPGEKLYEELFYSNEKLLETGFDKIHLANSSSQNNIEFKQFLKELTNACMNYDEDKIKLLVDNIYLNRENFDQTNVSLNNIVNIK